MTSSRRNGQRFSGSTLGRIGLRSNQARPLLRSAQGQAVTELAIVLPIIMLVILGILDFGRAYNYKNDLTSLANQAVRYAEVNNCPACGTQQIEQYVPTTADSSELQHGGSGLGIESPGTTISFCLPSGGGGVGEPIEAVATAKYRWIPYLSLGSAPLTSTAIGRVEVLRTTDASGNYLYGPPGPIPHCS